MENISTTSNKTPQFNLECDESCSTDVKIKKIKNLILPLKVRIEGKQENTYKVSVGQDQVNIPIDLPQDQFEKFFLNLKYKKYYKKIKISNKYFKQVQEFSNLFHLHKLINKAMVNDTSLHSLFSCILNLDYLKDYQAINLFVHEKGNTLCTRYDFEGQSLKKEEIRIQEFTNLFNSIKKSRNKSFGEVQIKGSEFNILGTFLGLNFTFKHHSIILTLSRNDFLPQEKNDKKVFENLSNILIGFVVVLLKNKSLDNETKLYEEAINNFPAPLRVSSKSIDYKNKLFLKMNEENLEEQVVGEYKLLSNLALLRDDDKTELYHQQRISILGELLNTLRHELSNPLFGLQLSSELLLLEELEEDQVLFMQQITKSIKRSQKIIKNFQNLFTNTESLELINPVEIINEVFTLTKSESKHLKKDIIFSLSSKEIQIKTNSTWLAQIFFNLIINSAHALQDDPNAKITITLDIVIDKIIIIFSDNGPGISRLNKDKVFTSFFTTKERGTGLGLAISKQLAQKLNGDLNLLNTGNGASFELILPYENTNN